MRGVHAEIMAMLTPWQGVAVWRDRLPSGFDNSHPAVVISVDSDTHAMSGSTRAVVMTFRVYGGSPSYVQAETVFNELCSRLSAARSRGVLFVGNLRGQQLPPDPDVGWPSYNLRTTARLTER